MSDHPRFEHESKTCGTSCGQKAAEAVRLATALMRLDQTRKKCEVCPMPFGKHLPDCPNKD